VQVHSDPRTLSLHKPAVSIGIFDGVHRGHRLLLDRLKSLALNDGLQTLILTFWPHPRIVLGKTGPEFGLLNSLPEKTAILADMGIDHLLIVPFSEAFAAWPPERFLHDFIDRYLKPGLVVVGDDLRFGAGGEGNLNLLKEFGEEKGFIVYPMDTQTDDSSRISSTRIRTCLIEGDIEGANRLLGYEYFLFGHVVRGNRIGSTIGFPTANIQCDEDFKQIPHDGVYAVMVVRNEKLHKGMLNIGIRPTVGGGSHKTIEVHLFGVQDDLYGEKLQVRFIARLRDEMKFSGLDGLRDQLGRDRIDALEILDSYEQMI
jgi:riboflavin kinase/FMN adenylyltransferase